MIAAVTLYLVFASGLVMGDLVPTFRLSDLGTRQDDFANFIANWQPAGPVDYSKALVWGFVAGFSERFVPDLLARFASQAPEPPSKQTDRPDPEKGQDGGGGAPGSRPTRGSHPIGLGPPASAPRTGSPETFALRQK